MKLKYKKKYWLIGLIVVTGMCQVQAGLIDPDLKRVLSKTRGSQKVPVIIHFQDMTGTQPVLQANKSHRKNKHRKKRKSKRAAGVVAAQSVAKKQKRMRHRLMRQLKRRANASQPLVKRFLRRLGHHVKRDLWVINALAVDVPAWMVPMLSRAAVVDRIELDRKIQVQATLPGAAQVPVWNLDMVGASKAWDWGVTGEGVVVASLDTGVDGMHPDLAPRWRGGLNSWFDPYGQHPSMPFDARGHGTGTMGIMVGGSASGVPIGVAPRAKWIAAKIFRDDGAATISAIHAAFQWLLDPDGDPTTDDAPDVVNNSWGVNGGTFICSPSFHPDIDALRTAGIVAVFSAGNSGPYDMSGLNPANYQSSDAVGAIADTMEVASFSSRGPSPCGTQVFPKVVAPGVSVYTAKPTGAQVSNPYQSVSGTSFSAPHLAGAYALLKSAVPTATVAEVEQAIADTAADLGNLGPDNAYGYGMIDIPAAIAALRCPGGGVDSDDDGWLDACDNCIEHYNPSQKDSDGDGYGNACDADLNNDGVSNIGDFPWLREAYFNKDAAFDFNDDGTVNAADIQSFRLLLFRPVGPSALKQ